MQCKKCLEEFIEKEIQEHHLHPRFMDNPKGLGKKVPRCKKCHDIIHGIIAKVLWCFIPENKKEECIREVIKLGEKY